MRIGLVDLDTSHPATWLPILRELGHEVIGVFDHHDVHAPTYAKEFACTHGVPRVFESLEEMVQHVDLAILHGCNWDRHVERAAPFVAARRAVLIDKPVAGSLRDLDRIEAWARSGVRITGGSSLRVAQEVRAYLAESVEERGEPHTVLCGCAVDDFNYGIHAYAMLAAILGADAVSIRHVRTNGGQRRFEVRWSDGQLGWLVVGEAAAWQPFYATVVSDRGCRHIQPDIAMLYRALLTAVLPFLAGEVDEPPFSPGAWLAPERWALAAKQSLTRQSESVLLDGIDASVTYDGRACADAYRRQKYPKV